MDEIATYHGTKEPLTLNPKRVRFSNFLRKRHIFRILCRRYQSLGANISTQGTEDALG